jgi:hypothetical protein
VVLRLVRLVRLEVVASASGVVGGGRGGKRA